MGKGASVITECRCTHKYYRLRTFRTRVVIISAKTD